MAEVCGSCGKDVGDDKFECDACTKQFHLACDSVRKGDVTARATSKNLKLYCTRCMSYKLEIANAEKLSIIYKYVTKIDMQTQQQISVQAEAVDKLDKIIADSTVIKNNIDDVKNTIGSKMQQECVNEKKTFSSVVRAAAKPAVIIKPKDARQNSATTSKDIKEQIDYKCLDVCDFHNVGGGGIAVTCESSATTMTMKEIISSKFGEKYDVNLPKILKPRIKIINAMNDMDESDIVCELKRQNAFINEDDSIELKKVIKKKNNKFGDIDIVLEVNIEAFDRILEAGKVKFGWKICAVVHHVHITRCFNCCGFSHISTQCKNKQACGRCGKGHKTSDCKQKKEECINCKSVSIKYKLKLDTNHNAYSHKCPTLMKKVDSFAKKFISEDNI